MSGDRPERFFKVIVRADQLHFVDIRDWEPWDPARLVYRSAAEVAWILRVDPGARIVRTRQELDDALAVARQSGRALSLYAHESLTPEVASRWRRTSEGTAVAMVRSRKQARETPA